MKKLVIDEAFLEELERLQTVLKNNVAGMFGGNRQSKSFGSSCEFADYRDYMPGDDITKIDWNAYARFDKLYEKLYFDERQMHTKIYIDASRSMIYGDGTKAEQAIRLAAAWAYLSVCEMDKVSIYAIHDGVVTEVISGMVGKDSYLTYINKLNDIEFGGDIFWSEALLPSSVGMGDGISVLISDFLTDNDYEQAIDFLASKRRDIVCMQILSREEINPQIRGKVHLFDSENSKKDYRKNVNKDISDAYKRALKHVIERIKNYCEARGASYLMSADDVSVGDVFFGTLSDMGVVE